MGRLWDDTENPRNPSSLGKAWLHRAWAVLTAGSSRTPYLLWTVLLAGWLSLGVILGSLGTLWTLLYLLFRPVASPPRPITPRPPVTHSVQRPLPVQGAPVICVDGVVVA